MAAYRQVGGLAGAITARAETLYRSLDDDERAAVRQRSSGSSSCTPTGNRPAAGRNGRSWSALGDGPTLDAVIDGGPRHACSRSTTTPLAGADRRGRPRGAAARVASAAGLDRRGPRRDRGDGPAVRGGRRRGRSWIAIPGRCIFLILLFGRSVAFAWQAPTPAGATPAPPLVSLRSIQERRLPAYTPVRMGQRVTVSGVVATRAANFGEYAHLPIQGDENFGLFIERARGALDAFSPGDVIQATGVVGHRSGPPVLVADSISKQGERATPETAKTSDLRFDEVREYRQVHYR